MGDKQIIAMGGGGFAMESTPLLDSYVLSAAGVPRPRVCFLPTASGDNENFIVRFYRAMGKLPCEPSHLELFRREGDLEERLLSQQVIYVGGGNTANMLAIWRLHGVDSILRRAWEQGVVLTGLSAGAICWFDSGTTDSFGEDLAPLECLGLLAGSFSPHYDSDAARRPRYHELIGAGKIASGLAADDSAAAHFVGDQLRRCVSSRDGARVFRVERIGEDVTEKVLATEYLG